jgi:hypothetical protein
MQILQSTQGIDMSNNAFTVGDLKRSLSGLSDDVKLTFAGDLSFYRVKRWGDDEIIIEFNEAQADLTPEFKKKNPQVKAAFISTDAVEWDANGMTGTVSVTIR